MNKLKKLKTEMRKIVSLYYDEHFRGKDFDLGLLLATEKGIILLKEAYIYFILLRNTLQCIKRTKKLSNDLSQKQIQRLNDMFLGAKCISRQLLDILLPILENIGD